MAFQSRYRVLWCVGLSKDRTKVLSSEGFNTEKQAIIYIDSLLSGQRSTFSWTERETLMGISQGRMKIEEWRVCMGWTPVWLAVICLGRGLDFTPLVGFFWTLLMIWANTSCWRPESEIDQEKGGNTTWTGEGQTLLPTDVSVEEQWRLFEWPFTHHLNNNVLCLSDHCLCFLFIVHNLGLTYVACRYPVIILVKLDSWCVFTCTKVV